MNFAHLEQGTTRPQITPMPWRARKRRLLSFVWVFLAVLLSIGAWSLATPLTKGPDEPDHMIQAAAVVRGQFGGTQAEEHFNGMPIGEVGAVEVPRWVLLFPKGIGYSISTCAARTKSCQFVDRPARESSDTVDVLSGTQFSRFPPLYYLIVGLPTLFASGGGAQWAMRFMGVVLDSALIALGVYLLARYHPRRLPLLAVLVALSPMVLFLTSVVNASGMEIASGFAAWCGGLCVVERRPRIPPLLAISVGVCLGVLILSRPISLYNAGVLVVTLALFLGWAGCRRLLRERSFCPTWIFAALSSALAVCYLLAVGEPYLEGVPHTPALDLFGSMSMTLHLTGGRLLQLVGNFGWVQIPAPMWVQVLWTVALLGLIAYGVVVSHQIRRALPFLATAIIVMPLIFEAPRINAVGAYWSGRYWLPLAVGLPILASSGINKRATTVSQGLPAFLIAGMGLIAGQLASFLVALNYWVATNKFSGVFGWRPLVAPPLVVALFIVGQILLFSFLTQNYLDEKRTLGSCAKPGDARVLDASAHA